MSPEGVLALAASAVTVGGGVVAVVRRLRRRRADSESPDPKFRRLRERTKPLDFELIPIRFEVSTTGPIPRVVVTLRAANYNRKPLTLTSVRVSYLQAHERGSLEEIKAPDEYEVPARQSREVYCRRALVEAEAALFRELPHQTWLHGGCTIAAVGKIGKRDVRFEPAGITFVIYGTRD